MKWTQLVLSVAFPGIVATLAAGTMYLSVRAAQQDVEFNPLTPPLPETAPVATPALSADQIRPIEVTRLFLISPAVSWVI